MTDGIKKRRRRRNGLLDVINGILTLIVLVLLAAAGLVLWGAHAFYADGPTVEEATFQVERGNGLSTVAHRLEDAGLIEHHLIFQLGTIALKKERDLKAGEFRIASGASMADILEEITEGSPIIYAVTIPEGFTSWQVVERLKANATLTGEITEIPAEGTLLPDTYVFERGDTRQEIIDRMEMAQQEALAEIWEGRDPGLPLETPQELVILASIVEKETGLASERPQVAAVFVNRLKKGMRLQSDPTIIYGITLGQEALGRGLRKSEIEAETPYNTYKIDGLPAGPIANPGIESLRAVANPADTDDLYFVAAGPVPSDGHLFAATYHEHRQNVAKWRAIEREAAAEAAREALEAEAAEAAGDEVTAGEGQSAQ